MLSEQITKLFHILGCNNTDIAKCVGCSSSYIRLIHINKRGYSPKDKPIALLADGIYHYADKENQLTSLSKLCHTTGNSREVLIPAIVALLFNTDNKSLPEISAIQFKNKKADKNRFFGEKLNYLLNLLELSNARLARTVNVDDSYISRFRSGVRSPAPESEIARLIMTSLYNRACEQNRLTEISKYSNIPLELLSKSNTGLLLFSSWLFEIRNNSDERAVNHLLECIDSFSLHSNLVLPDITAFLSSKILSSSKTLYYGIDGLREAVIRFLGNSLEQGGELWLYSDEDIAWMVKNKDFFMKWSALMLACVSRGIKVKIIHNIDRGMDEMISAIQSWMPLYMSGMIEPYVSRKGRDTRFSHTLFLRPGAECIFAMHIRGTEKNSTYEYLTEVDRVIPITSGTESLFAQSDPLVRIYINNINRLFYHDEKCHNTYALLPSPSLGTLSEKLLLSMLSRCEISPIQKEQILNFCQAQREAFHQTLSEGCFYEFIPLPDEMELYNNSIRLSLAPSINSNEIFYTPDEFAEHIRDTIAILDSYSSYNLSLIHELPFNDIQVILTDTRVIIIKNKRASGCFCILRTNNTSCL